MTYRVLVILVGLTASMAHAEVSNAPEVPFKLATFEADGLERVGMLIDGYLVDLQQANTYLIAEAGVSTVDLANDMKTLIEQSETAKPRLFQIANYLSGRVRKLEFSYDPATVAIKAPIKYPWNLLAAGRNYRAHAAEMGDTTDIDADANDPFLFAKSPRSSIIASGQPYVIPAGREQIDWEGEFSIVVGRQAKNLNLENAMEYVFGFTILHDVSDRAAQKPVGGRYKYDWFAGKSMDNAAPMGPYIVMKEFLPNYGELRLTTRVNKKIMQDSNTSYLIHDVEHLMRFASSIMTLWPGDVIATGTPAGVGKGRKPPVYLKPGDTVTIEIEGIGTLLTPIE